MSEISFNKFSFVENLLGASSTLPCLLNCCLFHCVSSSAFTFLLSFYFFLIFAFSLLWLFPLYFYLHAHTSSILLLLSHCWLFCFVASSTVLLFPHFYLFVASSSNKLFFFLFVSLPPCYSSFASTSSSTLTLLPQCCAALYLSEFETEGWNETGTKGKQGNGRSQKIRKNLMTYQEQIAPLTSLFVL